MSAYRVEQVGLSMSLVTGCRGLSQPCMSPEPPCHRVPRELSLHGLDWLPSRSQMYPARARPGRKDVAKMTLFQPAVSTRLLSFCARLSFCPSWAPEETRELLSSTELFCHQPGQGRHGSSARYAVVLSPWGSLGKFWSSRPVLTGGGPWCLTKCRFPAAEIPG